MSFNLLVSNEQAFRALTSGDKLASGIILENFIFYIRGRAGYYVAMNDELGLEYPDLDLIGHCALISAMKMYRGDEIPFAPFATVVVQNAMLNFIKQFRTPTAAIIQRGLSLDDHLFDGNNSLLMSDIVTEHVYGCDLGFYSPSAIGYFEDLLPAPFSALEKDVILEKISGYTFQEIKEKLNVPKRKLDTTISELKTKWFPDDF